MGSVETVTVLFTDLVGSTALSSQVGPTAAERLRQEHFAVLRAAIADVGGREVKNVGDGLMVAFGSAAAAVDCAVGMQQRLEQRNRRSDQLLSVRIGVALGDADHDGEDYFGPPVVEASRLCDEARGGQILCGEMVRMMAGGRGEHRFEGIGELELKGLPEPVSAFEVGWAPLGLAATIPLPALLRALPPVGYVGREAEQGLSRSLFEQVAGGGCRLALISGEPGIGKTRLATLAALEAHGEGANVLYGRCEEGLVVPYGPWVEGLRHWVLEADEDALSVHVERHGGELCRLLPELARRVSDLPAPTQTDPETERYLLFGAVGGLLSQVAEQEPLVVVLDDLHWADKGSLLLLRHLVAQGALDRVLLLGTYRASDITRRHPLAEVLADLRCVEGVERIDLEGLERGDVIELMQAAAGHELDDDGIALAGEIVRETDGNPFFVAEILRHLNESGAIAVGEDGRWHLVTSLEELGLPESVREVVGRRVERLDPEAARVLSTAAVIGRQFDLELLACVLARPEDELLDLLEASVEASVIAESAQTAGRFVFAHALINHTLYEDLGHTRRARLHRRIAEALEAQLGADPGTRVGELAHHWAKATTAIDLEKAILYARMAGERALAELAPDEALRWFGRALELLSDREDPATRCDLLIGLGEAHRQTGAAEYRETLLQAARIASGLEDGERAAKAALANSRGQPSAFGQLDQERVAAIERALELDDDLGRRALLLSLEAMELVYEHDRGHRRALAEEALAIARKVGDTRTTARVLSSWLYAFRAPDTLQLRLGHLDELRASAEAAGDPALQFWAADAELTASAEAGDLVRADAAFRRIRAIAERLGEPTLRFNATYVEGCLALARGDLGAAEGCAGRALQIGNDAGEPDALMICGAQITLIRRIQGRAGENIERQEQNVKANPLIPAWRAGLAATLCWLGRTDEGAAIVAEAARDRFEHVPWEEIRTTALALYAEAASQGGVTDAAAILYELIEPWADQVVCNRATAYGHARTYLGMLAATLGWHERADDHFKLACELQERDGMLVWAARAHLGWAEALVTRGEGKHACEQATRALELAREHGYAFIEQRAAAILEAKSPVG